MFIFTLIGAHTVIYLDLLWMVGQFFHLFSSLHLIPWLLLWVLFSFSVFYSLDRMIICQLFHLGWLHSFSHDHLKTFSIPMVFSRKPNSSNSFKCPDWIISQFNWFGFIATWGCELIQIFLLPHRLNLYHAFHVCESKCQKFDHRTWPWGSVRTSECPSIFCDRMDFSAENLVYSYACAPVGGLQRNITNITTVLYRFQLSASMPAMEYNQRIIQTKQ